jgi:hypothetical protein
MYRFRFTISNILTFSLLVMVLGVPVHAMAGAPIVVAPAVIDGEAKAREILRYTVTITNTEDRMVTVYPWARDLDEAGEVPVRDGVDQSESLLAWMEFSRAQLSVPPKGTVELPLLIQVNLRAKPGVYHAIMHVSDGPNRPEAELNTAGTASIVLNIRVPDDANERLQLGVFGADKQLFAGDTAQFSYRLENTGNRGIVPTGKIRIFDRKGEEVDVVEVNKEGEKIEPAATEMLGAVWASGEHFGKYKAMLDMSYGKSGTIQDTVYFWVLPWKRLLSLFLSLALIAVVLSLLVHSYTTSGGKKLATVRARAEDLDDLVSRAQEIGRQFRFPKRQAHHAHPTEDVSEAPTPALSPLIELTPPAPSRTRYSIGLPGKNSHESHTPVQLKSRQKHEPHPNHVVRLK